MSHSSSNVLRQQAARAACARDRIDDLVLEDPGEPGLEARLAGESAARKRGEHRFLHDVLGRRFVAQLQPGDPQQIAAMRASSWAAMSAAQACGATTMALP